MKRLLKRRPEIRIRNEYFNQKKRRSWRFGVMEEQWESPAPNKEFLDSRFSHWMQQSKSDQRLSWVNLSPYESRFMFINARERDCFTDLKYDRDSNEDSGRSETRISHTTRDYYRFSPVWTGNSLVFQIQAYIYMEYVQVHHAIV